MSRTALSCVAGVALGSALLLSGCTTTTNTNSGETGAVSGDPIVIGAVIAETGFMNQYDLPAMATVEMAIEDINEAGGLLGRPLELVSRDYKSERDLSASVAQEVIDAGADVLIVSCDYDFGSPAALAAQSAGLMSVSLCAGSDKFGPRGGLELGFSAGLLASATSGAAAQWGSEQGWSTAYVLEDPTIRVDTDWANGFSGAWTNINGEGSVLGHDTFQNEDPSIAAQISKIQALATPPDVIAIASYAPGGASALRQIRAAGITTPVVLSDALDSTAWLEAVPDLSNTWGVNHAQFVGEDPSEKVNEIVERYEEAEGSLPPSSLLVDGYIAMQMIATAIEAAGSTDGAAMTEALVTGEPVETVVGDATFTDEEHTSADRPVTIVDLSSGQPVFVDRLTADYIAPLE